MATQDFLNTRSHRPLIVLNALLLGLYFFMIAFTFTVASWWLFLILIIVQVYFFFIGITYLYLVWDMRAPIKRFDSTFAPSVDVFVTVCGEPTTLIRPTIKACKQIDYPHFKIHILNDGKVAGKANWQAIEKLAADLEVNCITREIPGGAKAGNINSALTRTDAPYVLILDADHIPKPSILKSLVPPFSDPKMGFVQSPQYYRNHACNNVTQAAWSQQTLFFGAISRGKNRLNATSMSGTNMLVSREALLAVDGMDEANIAEDFLTGLKLHARGYKSTYVPKVLAAGLAPEDYSSYHNQQLRWAKGNLEVLFTANPLFLRGLDFGQRVAYISSCFYYLYGVVIMLTASLPIVFFLTGQTPFLTNSMALAAAFLPFIFVTILHLQQSSNHTYGFHAIAYSIGSVSIFLQALGETLIGKRRGFFVTSKTRLAGNYPALVVIQIAYCFVVFATGTYYLFHHGLTPAFITNAMWAGFYVICFGVVIAAALPDGLGFVRHLLAPLSSIRIRLRKTSHM